MPNKQQSNDCADNGWLREAQEGIDPDLTTSLEVKAKAVETFVMWEPRCLEAEKKQRKHLSIRALLFYFSSFEFER